MDIMTAVDKINATADYSASRKGSEISVTKYGRPVGVVTMDDLAALGHTATGWGVHLRKGALGVYRALTS